MGGTDYLNLWRKRGSRPNEVAALGYDYLGDLGIAKREAFRTPNDATPHHLYVCPSNSLALANHNILRDYLRGDSAATRAYSDLKKQLARTYDGNVESYGRGTWIWVARRGHQTIGLVRADCQYWVRNTCRLIAALCKVFDLTHNTFAMCQLLGMNGNTPTDICFSFDGFSARGGQTDVHDDGWGIAFFEGIGCRVFLDILPSNISAIADLVRRYPIKSKHVIAHIRQATRGVVALENCHPFQRELWGRYWVFAHNGTLDNFVPPPGDFYRAVGNTDSEAAFCWILERLRRQFAQREPSFQEVCACITETIEQLSQYGSFNFLLSDGEYLFAHCATSLHYLLRQAPFAAAHLIDRDITVDFSELTNAADRVAVIATTPLTDNENWIPFVPRQLIIFHDGIPV